MGAWWSQLHGSPGIRCISAVDAHSAALRGGRLDPTRNAASEPSVPPRVQ